MTVFPDSIRPATTSRRQQAVGRIAYQERVQPLECDARRPDKIWLAAGMSASREQMPALAAQAMGVPPN